ncbi:MAG: YafY family protein [Thermomicrobiales bacterium]
MRRSDRLTGILIALQGRQRTAADLATQFAVTSRTILRDIEALGELGIPIVAMPGRNGGYRIAEGFWLPPMQFSREEASVVLLALDHLADADASPLGTAHRSAIDKVRAALGPSLAAEVERGLASLAIERGHDPVDPATLDLLRDAIAHESWLRITYAGTPEPSERVILPRSVQLAGGRWYVDAADSLRQEWRRFRVSRIVTAHRCGAPTNAAATLAATEQADGGYHAETNPRIVVRLTAKGIAMAADHPDFQHHLSDDTITFRCPVNELPYYGRELIGFGPAAMILNPPELRTFVTTHLANLLAHFAVAPEPSP